MATWLHFVGKEYYSRARFIREARRYGITRRISVQDLQRVSWGDMVLLAQKDGASALVFGYFIVDRVSGLDDETMQEIRERYGATQVDDGGAVIERECGSYIAGPTYVVRASIQEIAAMLKERQWRGPLMVGGTFLPLAVDGEALQVRLVDVPHRMGFRAFDLEGFLGVVRAEMPAWRAKGCRGTIKVRGQFYGTAGGTGADEGRVQTVQGYAKATKAAS